MGRVGAASERTYRRRSRYVALGRLIPIECEAISFVQPAL